MLALMARGWVRSSQSNGNNNGFYGYFAMVGVLPTQTVLRSYWNIGLHGTYVNPGQYPFGGSYLRVGMAWATPEDLSTNRPTPITNADADWMDIETLYPSVVLASSVDNIWLLNWQFPKDESVKSQRKNDTSEDRFLWVAWEMSLFEPSDGFSVTWWSCTVDAYLNTP